MALLAGVPHIGATLIPRVIHHRGCCVSEVYVKWPVLSSICLMLR